MSDFETEQKPKSVDLASDFEWAYQWMGQKKADRPDPPSRGPSALLDLATKEADQFLGRFIQYTQRKNAESEELTKELREDRQETMLALKRLEQEIEPDVENVLREANVKFPVVFARVATELGWSKSDEWTVPKDRLVQS